MVSSNERTRRYEAIRQAMAAAQLDALVVAGVAEATQRGFIRYLSDWHLWGGSALMVVPLEREPTLILGSRSQVCWAEEIGWLTDITSSAPLPLVGAAIERLKRLPMLRRVGVVGYENISGAGDIDALKDAFPAVELIPATRLMQNIMMIKSQEEIDQGIETAKIVAQGVRVFGEQLQPGMTEREVMGHVHRYLRGQGVLDGIAHINSRRMEPFISPPSDRVIGPEDIVKMSLEFQGANGYWIELAGIFSFHEPPERLMRHLETTLLACERAADAMRPGMPAKDLTAIVEETYRAGGWEIAERVIWDVHGIGLNVIEPPQSTPADTNLLAEGMVLSMHPGLLVKPDNWGVYIQDNYLVTPQGGVRLSGLELQWNVVH